MEINNIGQLIQHLATKAGVDASNQHLINILSNSELSKITVHSDLVNAIDQSLLSMTVAKDNHPELRAIYMAQALNPIDSRIAAFIPKAKLTDEQAAQLEKERSTFKRFEMLTSFVEKNTEDAIEAAKSASSEGKGDKAALERQNQELLKTIDQMKSSYAQELDKVKADFENTRSAEKVQLQIGSMLSACKTTLDGLPVDVKHATIGNLINKELQDKQVEFAFDESGSFVMKRKDGSSYLSASNERIDPQSFIETILASNKLFVVNNQQQQQQAASGGTIIATNGPEGNNQHKTLDFNRKQREKMQKANA